MAKAIYFAWCVQIKALHVHWRCFVAGAVCRIHNGFYQFVHACYYDNAFRPVNHSGYAVSVAIDVYQLTGFGEGIGAGLEHITG